MTSTDVEKDGLRVGAMSHAFRKCLGTFLVSFTSRGTAN